MIKRLGHVNIGAYDLEAAEKFYCGVLGLRKAFEFKKDDQVFGFYLEVGETTFVEIFREGSPAPEGTPLLRHLCLEVEDIDTAIASIRAKGWPIDDKKFGADNAWQAWTRDPSGVPIELMQYTADSSQFTGRPCIVSW